MKKLQVFVVCLVLGLSAAYAQYEGGDNDGFSQAPVCASTLNGGAVFSMGTIIGSSAFCEGATESYTIPVSNAPANTYYNWTVPPGSAVTTGQGTNVIIVTFGSAPGNIAVDVITDCQTSGASMPVVANSCTFYGGGDNDGFSANPSCATNLSGGSVYSLGTIVGSSTFCEFGTESYSIVVTGAPGNTYYDWTIPVDATLVSGQGKNTILVLFGNTNGSIGVTVITDCTTDIIAPIPVSSIACSFYAGGDNDGFSIVQQCVTNLDGGSIFDPGPIIGSATFCEFATEAFTINVAGVTPEIMYNWTVPPGATIVSGQGTKTILVTFGNTSGNIAVDVSNNCQAIGINHAVVATNCVFYSGGDNDGFSRIQQCASNLSGGSTFIPGPIVGSIEFCSFASESYSIAVAGALPNTIYTWSVPPDASIVSGQGTNAVLIAFGNISGNVSVDVSNECETINISQPVTIANCIFYAGGDNDGFTDTQHCSSNLNGGSSFIPGPIVGSTGFCSFATEVYSITVAGALANSVYNWSVPVGSSVVSGQGTNTVLISFGSTSGNVSVAISNECETVNASLPVSVSSCIFYAGGNNDGFSAVQRCASNLNGGSSFIPGPIIGSSSFCTFSTEAYSIAVAGATFPTTYVWSGPPGSAVVSGQGTTNALIAFGSISGNVSVTISNACESLPVSFPVSISSCIFYAGGSNDGFSVTTASNIPLPIELVSFEAVVKEGVVYLDWVTASESDNDFFLIERSKDGQRFESVTKIDGGGTSIGKLKYQAKDMNPYEGVSYYRLSQTDYDGAITYFRVILVRVTLSFNEVVRLYPNPVNRESEIHLDFYSPDDDQVKITIVDPAGISTQSEMIKVSAGLNVLNFTPNFKSSGVYIIILHTRDKPQALRLVVL